MIVDLIALARPGLYVIEFPLYVKIGQSRNLLTRLGHHGDEGGIRAWVSQPVADVEEAEKVALRMAIDRSGMLYLRGRLPERFPGLTFGEAVELTQDVADMYPLIKKAA